MHWQTSSMLPPSVSALDRTTTSAPFLEQLTPLGRTASLKLTAKRKKLLQSSLAERDQAASPVLKKVHRAASVEPDPLRGLFEVTMDGVGASSSTSPTATRDSEQVPLLEDGGIERSFAARCCRTPPTREFVPQASRSATRSASPVTSTSPSRCAPSTRFARRSSRSSRRQTDCWQRSSGWQTHDHRSEHYPAMKPSGVERLGDVPEHWDVRRAKRVFSLAKNWRERMTSSYLQRKRMA